MKYQKELEEYIDSKERELIAATARVVAVPSTKGEAADGAPFGPGPAAALKEALVIAKEWGLAAESYDNYVGLVDTNGKPTNLHILCHMDVVDPGSGWETDPYQLVEKDGIIYGRGVDDDKGPAMISMLALRAVKDLGIPLKNNARLILGTDEESGSEDIAYYYAREPFAEFTFSPDCDFPVTNVEKGMYRPTITADCGGETALPRVASMKGGIRTNVVSPEAEAEVLGIDPSGLSAYMAAAAERTGVRFEAEKIPGGSRILAHGKNGHAAFPESGNSANTALLDLLASLPLAENRSAAALRSLHKLFPHGDNYGVGLGIAQSDEVSGELTAALTLMSLTDGKLSAFFDARVPVCANDGNCKAVCEAACAAEGLSCRGSMYASHYVPEDSAFVQTLLKCYENYSGRKGFCVKTGGGTYVHNIPGGVAFGAGNDDFSSNLHAANERARISSMLTAAKIYAQAIVELCGE